MGLFAIALYLQVRGRFLLRFHGRWTLFKVIVLSGEGLKAFGFLCVISALLVLAGQLFGIDSGIVRVVRPDSPVLWCNFFLGTLLAVFYEEVVYRLYLPEMFRLLIPKLSPVLSEFAAVLFFALGHVYLGALGFLNALGCGIALRLCIRKTHSIWFSFAAHAVYNFGSFFFLLLQS